MEDVVVVKITMLDLTPDMLVSKLRAALAGHGIGLTADIESFVRDAAAKPGVADAMALLVAALPDGSPVETMRRMGEAAGVPAPEPRFDPTLLRELARNEFARARALLGPDVEAFFDKVARANVPPDGVKALLGGMATGGVQAALVQVGARCGAGPAPRVTADADAVANHFKDLAEAGGLVYTPSLDAFIRALVAKGAEPHVLGAAASSLCGQSQKALLADLGAPWGLTPPPLSVDVYGATEFAR